MEGIKRTTVQHSPIQGSQKASGINQADDSATGK
jgi:hypothetical protein